MLSTRSIDIFSTGSSCCLFSSCRMVGNFHAESLSLCFFCSDSSSLRLPCAIKVLYPTTFCQPSTTISQHGDKIVYATHATYKQTIHNFIIYAKVGQVVTIQYNNDCILEGTSSQKVLVKIKSVRSLLTKICKHTFMCFATKQFIYLATIFGKCGPFKAASIYHLKKHARRLPKWVRIQFLRLIPLGADPGRLGDRGGIGGGAPFRPPVVSKVALKALSLNHGCLNLVDP